MRVTPPSWLASAASGSERHQAWCRDTLGAYFGVDGDGRPRFSGARFNSLGRDEPDRLTPDDLVAVTLLSVDVPKHAAIRLLEEDAEKISSLLVEVGPDEDLHTVGPDRICHASAAERLWNVLRARGQSTGRRRGDTVGIGETTTSKLLARKRPRLLPVYDSIVAGQLGLGGAYHHWEGMHELLRETRYVEELRRTREAVDTQPGISLLRVFDILVWMSVREDHRPPA